MSLYQSDAPYCNFFQEIAAIVLAVGADEMKLKLSLAERIIIAVAVLAAVFTLGFFAGRSGGSSFVVETEKQAAQAEQATASDDEPEDSPEQEEALQSKVNINTADSATLQTLPGIGEALAGRIISYREENGDFAIIEEITDVNGIGDKLFENLKDLITVD